MEELVLNNSRLKVEILASTGAYNGARFDHSAQVKQITLDGKHTFLTSEKAPFDPGFGFGLLNEFDIQGPCQSASTPVGSTFHKIGVGGLMRENAADYFFYDPYPIAAPLDWNIEPLSETELLFSTLSPVIRGMQYRYVKRLMLAENKLIVSYTLENTGEVAFSTENYAHNFISFDQQPTGRNTSLATKDPVNRNNFGEFVDPESLLEIGQDALSWSQTPTVDFFVEHLMKNQGAGKQWTLSNSETGTSISESVDFPATHLNLWGKEHVVSPEAFHAISLSPGETSTWCRTYEMSYLV